MLKRPARSARYLLLDCRHSVEKQLLDALYIEGSVSVPLSAQEEICALARTKSILLDHDDMDMGANTDPVEIERAFSRAIGGLSTRAASAIAAPGCCAKWRTWCRIAISAAPSLAQRPDGLSKQHILNLEAFYRELFGLHLELFSQRHPIGF